MQNKRSRLSIGPLAADAALVCVANEGRLNDKKVNAKLE
jgi:hypothetical protein